MLVTLRNSWRASSTLAALHLDNPRRPLPILKSTQRLVSSFSPSDLHFFLEIKLSSSIHSKHICLQQNVSPKGLDENASPQIYPPGLCSSELKMQRIESNDDILMHQCVHGCECTHIDTHYMNACIQCFYRHAHIHKYTPTGCSCVAAQPAVRTSERLK